MSSQGVHNYSRDGVKFVVKLHPNDVKLEREIGFMEAAGNLSVSVVGHIYDPQNVLVGFVMPLLRVIEPAELTSDEKVNIFSQIRQTIPELHNRQIIHGDVKLSNMLLDETKLKLCDFGTSAWTTKLMYPEALSLQWCSPYRLNVASRQPLIAHEDIYAGGIAVWELFVGETPFEDIDPDDEEADLEGQIRPGLRVDIERIEVEEARQYAAECLRTYIRANESMNTQKALFDCIIS
jgi:serine/threonine protein kinase